MNYNILKFIKLNEFFFIILILFFSLCFIFINTGLHGDDFSIINEYKNNSLKYFLSLDPSIRNQNMFGILNHYFFYWTYPILKYEHQYIYDLFKIIIHLVSCYFIFKFISLYLSKNRSIFFSFGFIFFPIHDSTTFWYMTAPYVFTPAIIMYAGYLLKKNYNLFLCMLVLLIGAFTSYSSPPFLLGLAIIFLFEKEYRNFLITFITLISYSCYYFTLSYLYSFAEKRLSSDIDILKVINNYILQFLSNLDTFIGPSFYLKIIYSVMSLNFFSFLLASLVVFISFKFSKHVYVKFNIPLFVGFLSISLSSLFIYSLTSLYWQSPFNLGNRITVPSTLLFIFLLCNIRNNKFFILFFAILIIYPIFGLSSHWKNWNYNQKQIINNIKNSEKLKIELTEDDLLIVTGNMYSKLGDFSHIELFIMPWITDSIFLNHVTYSDIFSINQYSILNKNILTDKKFGTSINLDNYKNIFLYSTNRNLLKKLKISDLNIVLDNIEYKNRHWIQLIKNEYLIKFILKIDPKLKYLFKNYDY